ncbi:PleD family two-component system response regulator [Nostoc sp. FACHB-280]|uniref:response regulator n=1 Tax=Nostoc sp. FACHB-280 TaxID=2692839 RepID=UPI00168AB669|nr:response regulator [Nostoc sp. FACHB-280]MBD2495933.1 response regulator [Nostoc sp. FACHB-280]
MSITWVGTILILEDALSELANVLGDKGYKIIKAKTAKEALEMALEEKPDAIITNVFMPGMNGFELCRFLTSHPSQAKAPILICSTTNQTSHLVWGRKQGADAYLSKPYTAEELLSAIQLVEMD